MKSLPLPLQVWLLNQGLGYDSNPDPDYFSATELLNPIQQIVLGKRLGVQPTLPDVYKTYQAAIGSAIHGAVEKAWEYSLIEALELLGFSPSVAAKVLVNPEDSSNCTPVWMEQRVLKKVGKYTVGGKYDFIFDGQLYDIKTTTVSRWKRGNRENYRMQGSIYKWLAPDKIKENTIRICYIIRDWSQGNTYKDDYPKSPFMTEDIDLLSPVQTEAWVEDRLNRIEANKDVSPHLMERCKEEELWKTPDKYKYYTREGQQRATKVFENAVEAFSYLNDRGTGRVEKVHGEYRRCGWCPVFSLCEQKNEYFSR